jgi:predicted glycosyltransferase
MDLAVLEKKAFFIPTPGQFEQEYLARRLKGLGIVPSCKQEKFTAKELGAISFYKGLEKCSEQEDLGSNFSLFHSE